MEIELSELIKFCTRKLNKRTHFMSPLKMINLFQDMMPSFPTKNVGLDVSRLAIFMINRSQLKPKNQVLGLQIGTACQENSVNLSISAGGLNLLPNFQKKKGGA